MTTPLTEQLADCLIKQDCVDSLLESIRLQVEEKGIVSDIGWMTRAIGWRDSAVHQLQGAAVVLEDRMDAGEVAGAPVRCLPFEQLQELEQGLGYLLTVADDKAQKEFDACITRECDKEKVLLLLLHPLVDPAAQDNAAIRLAADKGHLDLVNRLLQDARVDPAVLGNRAIHSASVNGHVAVVDRLLQDARVYPAAMHNWAIRSATFNGHLAVVDRLLQDGRVDPAAHDNEAIRWASENGHMDVVDRLLQDGRVDPAAKDNAAVRWASKNGNLDVVERLLQDGRVNPAAAGNAAIQIASKNGNLDVVERLLQDSRVRRLMPVRAFMTDVWQRMFRGYRTTATT